MRRGYADLTPDKKKIKRYDKEALARLWNEWPTFSLIDFGRHWGIPYSVIQAPSFPFSLAKKRAEVADAKRDFRQMTLMRASVPEAANEDDELVALRQMVMMIRELGHGGLLYAHQKMLKRVEGKTVPNMALHPSEAKNIMEVGAKAKDILMGWVGVRESIRDQTNPEETANTKPEIVADSPPIR